jgi:hypothetical protein
VVFPEGHIEHPVQSIFDLPVPAGGLQNLFGVGLKAGDKIPAFGLGFSFGGAGFR